jgi:hypothetical protein
LRTHDYRHAGYEIKLSRPTNIPFEIVSVVALMADRLIKRQVIAVRTAAWYTKELPTALGHMT